MDTKQLLTGKPREGFYPVVQDTVTVIELNEAVMNLTSESISEEIIAAFDDIDSFNILVEQVRDTENIVNGILVNNDSTTGKLVASIAADKNENNIRLEYVYEGKFINLSIADNNGTLICVRTEIDLSNIGGDGGITEEELYDKVFVVIQVSSYSNHTVYNTNIEEIRNTLISNYTFATNNNKNIIPIIVDELNNGGPQYWSIPTYHFDVDPSSGKVGTIYLNAIYINYYNRTLIKQEIKLNTDNTATYTTEEINIPLYYNFNYKTASFDEFKYNELKEAVLAGKQIIYKEDMQGAVYGSPFTTFNSSINNITDTYPTIYLRALCPGNTADVSSLKILEIVVTGNPYNIAVNEIPFKHGNGTMFLSDDGTYKEINNIFIIDNNIVNAEGGTNSINEQNYNSIINAIKENKVLIYKHNGQNYISSSYLGDENTYADIRFYGLQEPIIVTDSQYQTIYVVTIHLDKATLTSTVKFFDFDFKNDILTKTNSIEYIPTNDYHPATKKYVDDNSSIQVISVAVDSQFSEGVTGTTKTITINDYNKPAKALINLASDTSDFVLNLLAVGNYVQGTTVRIPNDVLNYNGAVSGNTLYKVRSIVGASTLQIQFTAIECVLSESEYNSMASSAPTGVDMESGDVLYFITPD